MVFAKSILHVIQILYESYTRTTLQCTQLKFCTWTNVWLRPTLHPMTFASLSQGLRRETAPVHLSMFIYREKYSATYKNCTPDDASHVRTFGATPPSLRYGGQSAPARNKTCTRADSYRQAKSTPPLPLCCSGASSPVLPPGLPIAIGIPG